jgi:hypothetical protein
LARLLEWPVRWPRHGPQASDLLVLALVLRRCRSPLAEPFGLGFGGIAREDSQDQRLVAFHGTVDIVFEAGELPSGILEEQSNPSFVLGPGVGSRRGRKCMIQAALERLPL